MSATCVDPCDFTVGTECRSQAGAALQQHKSHAATEYKEKHTGQKTQPGFEQAEGQQQGR